MMQQWKSVLCQVVLAGCALSVPLQTAPGALEKRTSLPGNALAQAAVEHVAPQLSKSLDRLGLSPHLAGDWKIASGRTIPQKPFAPQLYVPLFLSKAVAVLGDGKSAVIEAVAHTGHKFAVIQLHPESKNFENLIRHLPPPTSAIYSHNRIYALAPGASVDSFLSTWTLIRMSAGEGVGNLDTSFRLLVHGQRYQVNKFIGMGGDGVVYRAYSPIYGQDVILKTYTRKPEAYEREKWAMKLIAERTGSVRLLDSDDSKLLMVQRLIPGISLDNKIQTVRHDPEALMQLLSEYKRLVRVFYEQTGLIHGDVRPENVIMNPTDGSMTLIDFARTRFPKGKKGSQRLEKDLVYEEFYAEGEFQFSMIHAEAERALSQPISEQTKGVLLSYILHLKNRNNHASAIDVLEELVRAGNGWADNLYKSLYPHHPAHRARESVS